MVYALRTLAHLASQVVIPLLGGHNNAACGRILRQFLDLVGLALYPLRRLQEYIVLALLLSFEVFWRLSVNLFRLGYHIDTSDNISTSHQVQLRLQMAFILERGIGFLGSFHVDCLWFFNTVHRRVMHPMLDLNLVSIQVTRRFHIRDIDQYPLRILAEVPCLIQMRQVLVDARLHPKHRFLMLLVEVVQVAENLHGLDDGQPRICVQFVVDFLHFHVEELAHLDRA